MVNKKTRNIALSVSAALCFGALAGALASLRPLRASADEAALYTENFESLETSAGDAEIAAKGWKGSNRSIVDGSHGTFVAQSYQWEAGGHNVNDSRLYFYTANPFGLTLDAAKTYKVKWELWLNPKVTDNGNCTVMIQSGDTGKHNSVVVFEKGSVKAVNYQQGLQLTMVGGETSQVGEDGWYSFETTMKGTSDASNPNTGFVFDMTTGADQVAELNEKKEPTIRISEFEISENDGGGSLYKLSEKVTPGIVGVKNGIFGSTGFASNVADTVYTERSGIEGKTLKAVDEFTENTTTAGTELYLDKDASRKLDSGKYYSVKFDTAHFGVVQDTTFHFEQYTTDGGALIDSGDMKIVSAMDVQYTDADESFFKQEGCTVTENKGVYTVEAIVVGQGGEFKLSASVNAPNRIGEAGLYIDNISITEITAYKPPVPVEQRTYKTVYSEKFNTVDPSTAGSDAMYAACGFAGITPTDRLTIATEGGIDDSQALKAIYSFYQDTERWQIDRVYLDASKVSSTNPESVYRYTMKIKPFGEWKKIYIGFQNGNNQSDIDYVVLVNGGSTSFEASSMGGTLVKNATTYADGVFSVDVYLNGKGNFIFNFFNMQADEGEAGDTGFYLDDFKIQEEVKTEIAAGLNKTATVYNKTAGGDLSMFASLEDVTAVKIDGDAVDSGNYQFTKDSNLLVVKEAALKGLGTGERTLTVETSQGNYECKIEVIDIYQNRIYSMSLSSVSISGNDKASDEFWSASGNNLSMDPTASHWVVESTRDGLKFTPKEEQYSSFLGLINSNGLMITGWKAGAWNSLSFDVKATNAIFNINLREMKSGGGTEQDIGSLQIDIMGDRRVDNGEQSSKLCWTVEDVEGQDGWKHITVWFNYTQTIEDSLAYVRIQAAMADEDQPAEIIMDQFAMFAEFFPVASATASQYDKATEKLPAYSIDVYEANDNHVYSITEVKCGGTALQNTEYTVSYAGGTATLTFTKAFCDTKANETAPIEIEVTTSKGNTLKLTFTVIDSKPVLPAGEKTYDKASGAGLTLENVDMKGNPIAKITYGQNGEHTVEATLYDLTNDTLTLRAAFFANLAPATYEFTLVSNSGAKATFTVIVVDTTPVLGSVSEYDKLTATDFVITLDAKGQTITKVELGSKTLTASEYTYAEGKLTVKKSVFDALTAGTYTIKVTTATSSVSADIVVKDVPPVIVDGTYTAKQNGELVIDVDLKGRDIVSVSIGDEVLLASDYTYADGKLTVKSSILGELAVGKHTLTVTTAGGSDEVEFTLEEAAKAPNSNGGSGSTGSGNKDEEGEKKGCGSSIALAGGIAAATTLFAAAFVTKRKKH